MLVSITVNYACWHLNDLVADTTILCVTEDIADKLVELNSYLNGGDYDVQQIPKHRDMLIYLLEYINLEHYFLDDGYNGFCIYDITKHYFFKEEGFDYV